MLSTERPSGRMGRPTYPLTLRLARPTHASCLAPRASCAALASGRLRLALRTTEVQPPCRGIELRASIKLRVNERLLGDNK